MTVGPFAGFAHRPYGATGLTTSTWLATVPVREVALADLWLTQTGVRIKPLFGPHRNPYRPPFVVAYRGRLYLEDGHHRLIQLALAQPEMTHMPMLVHVVGEETR